VTLRGTAIENQAKVVISNSQFVATLNATGGNILVNQTITAGRVSLVSATGDIAQTAAGVITTNNTSASSFSAAGNVTLDVAANAFVAGNATAGSFNVSAANASLRSTNNFTLGTANVTGNLSLSAGSDKNIQLGVGSGSSATSVNVGGILAASTAGAGAITDNNDSSFNVAGGLALSAVNGDIVLDAATFPGAFNPSVRFGSVSASTAGNVTLSETTTLNLGNITAANLTAASTQGSIIDTGSLVVSNTANFTVSGNNNVVLDTFAAATLATPLIESRIAKLELNGGVDNSVTNLNAAVAVNSIKGASGTTTVTTASGNGTANAAITLGNVETGNLSLGAGGFIEIAGFSKISGNLSLSAAGVVNNVSTLASWTAPTATVAGNATSSSGRLSGMAASDTVGMLTFAVAPAVTVIGNGVGGVAPAVAATVEPTLNSLGQITGFNVTNNLAHSNYAFGVNPTLAFTGATNTSVLQSVNGALKVAGTTTLATAGNAVLYRNNDFNNVVLASPTGGAIINDINSVSVSGTAGGTVSVTAGANGTVSSTAPANIGSQLAEAGAWGVTLGNVSAGSLQVAANNGGAGNSGRIVQSTGSSISSFGTAAFTTSNNSITVTNAGNSFGRVQLTSGGGAISLTEDGTIKLGNLSSTNGTVTLTSRTGSIIEDSTGTALSAGANGTISLVAANGSILLGNATGLTTGGFGGNTTALGARINASAPSGSVALSSNGTNHLNLGAIEANTLRASAGGNLTQVAAAKVFGSTNLSSVSGDIAITNNGNNFGRVSVTGNANISIVEAATLNLGTVTMPGSGAGSFSATSVNGDIIDSGLSNVRLGGLVGAAGSGVVSLTATNGNIALDDPTTEFPTVAGVVFNAKNVTLAPLGLATIVLGATGQTAMASNLTVTSALGSISNSGAVKVTGDAAFQTSTGDITLVNTGNAFGTVRFAGGLVSITEADDVVLATGSSASKAAVFNALNGSISVANRGGTINLSKTSFFTASGNITLPKLITAGEQITLAAPGTMDLGALSQAGDLNGIAPIFIGVGAQVKPSP
jgi:fibronectin-binding autotransporter adhesin